jgi:hypothetical protein
VRANAAAAQSRTGEAKLTGIDRVLAALKLVAGHPKGG